MDRDRKSVTFFALSLAVIVLAGVAVFMAKGRHAEIVAEFDSIDRIGYVSWVGRDDFRWYSHRPEIDLLRISGAMISKEDSALLSRYRLTEEVRLIGVTFEPMGSSFLRDQDVTDLTIESGSLSSSDLREIATCIRIEGLAIRNLNAGEFDPREVDLSSWPSLSYLDLSHTSVSDDLFVDRNLPELAVLQLSHTSADGKFLQSLNTPGLIQLFLAGTLVGDEAMAHIERFSSLRILDLSGTEISDISVSGISKLNRLEFLHVERTNISEEGLAKILDSISTIRVLSVDKSMVENASEVSRDDRVIIR